MSNHTGVTEAKMLISQLNSIDLFDASAHRDAISKAQSLINTLQDPGDKAMETLFSCVTFPCLTTINDLRIFKKLSEALGPVTAGQLAEETGADTLLIARVMRMVTASGIVAETGPETYVATPVTKLYAGRAFDAGLHFAESVFPSLARFPHYLKEINYRTPDNTQQPSPFQYCMGTDLSTFEWLAQNPDKGNDFNLFMTNHRAQKHWSETFHIQAEIFDGVTINKDVPLIVDVAGGFGHDLRIVKNKLQPVTKGQLVLEDQASVIDTIPPDLGDPDIEYVKYNFFTPQPVKGARVYTLKSIIHDWPDHQALVILRNVASGMTPGYSKVWLLDGIVPATNTSRSLVGMDITMMVFLGALERTEKQWYELLEKSGLAVTKVVPRADGFGVIEAMLK